jgi:hypothetical protein
VEEKLFNVFAFRKDLLKYGLNHYQTITKTMTKEPTWTLILYYLSRQIGYYLVSKIYGL